MGTESPTGISHQTAFYQDTETLKRWLVWALKGDPAEERILREIGDSPDKERIICALAWIGAVV